MTITYVSSLQVFEQPCIQEMKKIKLKKGLVFSFSVTNNVDIFTHNVVVVQVRAGNLQLITINDWNRYSDNLFTAEQSVYESIKKGWRILDFTIYDKVSIDLACN